MKKLEAQKKEEQRKTMEEFGIKNEDWLDNSTTYSMNSDFDPFVDQFEIYVNKEFKITDREWICPECGARHDRDLLAANNILRRGIDELGDKINPQPSRAAVFVKS